MCAWVWESVSVYVCVSVCVCMVVWVYVHVHACVCVHICPWHCVCRKRNERQKIILPSYATNIVGSRCTASESLWTAVLSSFFISATDAAFNTTSQENQLRTQSAVAKQHTLEVGCFSTLGWQWRGLYEHTNKIQHGYQILKLTFKCQIWCSTSMRGICFIELLSKPRVHKKQVLMHSYLGKADCYIMLAQIILVARAHGDTKESISPPAHWPWLVMH